MNERRAVPRVVPAGELLAKVRGRLPARVVDISTRGAQLELESSLAPQLVLDVRLQLASGELVVRGKVRRCRASSTRDDGKGGRTILYRCGVEFEEVVPDAVARLTSEVLERGSVAVVPSPAPRQREGGPDTTPAAPGSSKI